MNRLILLLAGSGLPEREILRAIRELTRLNEAELLNVIAELRSFEKNMSRTERSYVSDVFELRSSQDNSSRLLGEQVSQMLRDGTGITTYEASERLMHALKKIVPRSTYDGLPVLNKESFSGWVQKLAVYIPASVILHEAAKIRNQITHSRSDWPLDEK